MSYESWIGFEDMPYEGWMNQLELFDPCYRRIRADLILTFTILHTLNHPLRELFTLDSTRVTRRHNLSVSIPHTRSNCVVTSFQCVLVSHEMGLPEQIATLTDLGLFKLALDACMSTYEIT